jgi:hypothetical protein
MSQVPALMCMPDYYWRVPAYLSTFDAVHGSCCIPLDTPMMLLRVGQFILTHECSGARISADGTCALVDLDPSEAVVHSIHIFRSVSYYLCVVAGGLFACAALLGSCPLHSTPCFLAELHRRTALPGELQSLILHYDERFDCPCRRHELPDAAV